MRQLTAEQVGDAPQFQEETVDEELRVAATAGAKPVVQARPPGFVKYNATTESVLGVSPAKLDLLGPEQVARSVPPLSQSLDLMKELPPGIAKNSATSKGDAGSFWSRDGGATSAAAAAGDVRSVAEARPLGIVEQSATTAAEAADTTGAKSVGEARPPEFAKQSATTEPELMESYDETGPSWSRANGDRAAATAAVQSAGETRPSRIVRYSVTSESESEVAQPSDEESSPRERRSGVPLDMMCQGVREAW